MGLHIAITHHQSPRNIYSTLVIDTYKGMGILTYKGKDPKMPLNHWEKKTNCTVAGLAHVNVVEF